MESPLRPPQNGNIIFSVLNNLDILIVWVHKAEGGDVGPGVFKLLHVHQMQVLGVIIIITSGRITRVNAA